jgi:hypothetical protein
MNYIAAEFDFDFDHKRMADELLAIPENKWLVSSRDNFTYKSLFITINDKQVYNDFKSAKTIPHTAWLWDYTLDIPYTRSVVESLPASVVGMVRVMWTNGPLPMHVDSDVFTSNDISYKMGVTLAPILHEPMTMCADISVSGKTVLFDDSMPHGFPTATTDQLGVRIFGEFDYEKFRILRTYSDI